MENVEDDWNDGEGEQWVLANDQDRQMPSLIRSDSDSEMMCSCCIQPMVRPTTLTCGHNFCRLCLARWYNTSSQMTCPTCRQLWVGYPKVNTALRNMILKQHPSVEEKEREWEEDENAQKTLNNFERKMKEISSGAQPARNPRAFIKGVMWTLAVIMVSYWAWDWRHSDDVLLIHKPVVRWRVSDVHRWLNELEWGYMYADVAQEKRIDGTMLLAMDENSIREVFEPENSLHERAFMIALKDLKARGVKMPSTLWEFKALRPGMTLALFVGMRHFPRAFTLYMYYAYYEDIFVPFVHFSTPPADGPNITFSWSDIPAPSTYQYITFVTNMVLVPYWTIACFAWAFLGVHYWTSVFVMATCLFTTLMEALSLKTLYTKGPKAFFKDLVNQHLTGFFWFLLACLFWPFIPKIASDIYFYVTLYLTPITLINTWLTHLRQQ